MKPFRVGRVLLAVVAATIAIPLVFAAQREFREYPSFEFDTNVELPPDYQVPAEFVVGRLMYPPCEYCRFGRRFGMGDDWTQGMTSWTVDYPRGDRDFARLLRRLTRIDVRSVEQPVNLDDGDDVYYWPFLIAGLPGSWELTDTQAKKLRDYLLRGGFLVCDSFFGTDEWDVFVAGIKRVFPDRPIVDLPADHPVFHTVYDLSNTKQIAQYQSLRGRGVPYRNDGAVPHWRGILDDNGRLVVLIAFNNDMGDGWQWQDEPTYPLDDANFSIKLGVNIVVYAMTH